MFISYLCKKNSYFNRLSLKEKQELEWNLSQAEKEGAQVFCIYGKDVVTEIAHFVKKNQVDCVVLGNSLKKRHSFVERESIASKLAKKYQIQIFMCINKAMMKRVCF